MALHPNMVLEQSSVDVYPQGALLEAGRVQEQAPAGVQVVHELSSDQEAGNRMRFMQTPQMVPHPEGILDPNISHGMLEFVNGLNDPNARNGASHV